MENKGDNEIRGDEYCVVYNLNTATIACQGALLLIGTEEYLPLYTLLIRVANERINNHLTLDLCKLEFLNSSGINTLTKFVIYVRNQTSIHLTVKGNKHISWQVRLLKNLQRLMPEKLATQFEEIT